MRTRFAPSAEHSTRKPKAAPLRIPFGGLPFRSFTLDEYHFLGSAGILTENDRCELIRGMIVEKPMINPRHKKAVRRLMREFERLLPEDLLLDVQGPVTLAAKSEPEPDLAITYGPEENYDERHAGPGEIALIVEVSDSTLNYDRGEKLELYAQARIPEYWIVDLESRKVEVRALPRAGKMPSYRRVKTYAEGQSISVTIGGKKLGAIRVDDILP